MSTFLFEATKPISSALFFEATGFPRKIMQKYVERFLDEMKYNTGNFHAGY